MKKNILVLAFILLIVNSFAQQYIVKFKINDKSPIPDFVSIDKIENNYITAYIWGYNNYIKIKQLFPDAIDLPPASKGKSIIMAQTLSDMQNWDRYPTYDLYVEMMQEFARKYPFLVRLDTIGYTQQGRLLLSVKITDNPDKEEFEPQFFYTSSMHGDELTGYVLMLHLIDYLLENYNKDSLITYLINNYEIYINPLANPDGAYHGGNNTVSGSIRYYADGQDPNRDFYPGPADPETTGDIETEAMKQYAQNHNFIMAANFHGGSEVYNFPWDAYASADKKHADDDWFRAIGKRYVDTAREQDFSYMSDVTNSGITEGGDWYVVHGSRQDYMNFVHHCKEVTIELSSTKLVSSDQLPYFWNLNYKSLIYYILEAEKGLQGLVLDNDNNPQKVKVYLVSYDKDSSAIYSFGNNGRYFRPLLPGNYHLQFIGDNATLLLDTNITITYGRNFLNYIPSLRKNLIRIEVFDTSMRPLNNVMVKILSVNKMLFTDDNGIDTVSLYTGIYEVHVIDSSLNYHQVFFESIYKDDTLRYILPSGTTNIISVDSQDNRVKIFPQPATEFLNLQGGTIQSVDLYSIAGKLIFSRQVNDNFAHINISSLSPGVYILKIRLKTGIVFKRFLVE